jgi:hypothetical protein
MDTTGVGWFRTLGPLFIGGETTYHYGGTVKTEWRIGVNLGARSFEWSWSVRHYTEPETSSETPNETLSVG